MLKLSYLLLLGQLTMQDFFTVRAQVPGADDEKDFLDEDYDQQYDLSYLTDENGNPISDDAGSQSLQSVFQATHQCFAKLINDFDVKTQTKDFMEYTSSDDWIETAQFANRDILVKKLGTAADPLTQKLMQAEGIKVVETMPYEMIEWIRDSTVLWIKNKGSGSATTEAEIKGAGKADETQKLKQYYDSVIKELKADSQAKDAKILNLYNTINVMNKRNDGIIQDTVAEGLSSTTDTVADLKNKHAESLKQLRTDLEEDCQNQHDDAIDELTETLNEECEENLSSFKKSITTEYQKGVKDLQKYLSDKCAANAATLKAKHTKTQAALTRKIAALEARKCDGAPPVDIDIDIDIEEEPEEEEEEKLEPEEEDTAPVPRVRPENTSGLKSWGVRSKFAVGSAMRVENKAFIQNQMEKEDYINGDYYHAGPGVYQYNSKYNSYITPITKQKKETSYSSYECSSFDWACVSCSSAASVAAADCEEHEFCFETDGEAKCGSCARYGKTCNMCSLEDGCLDCGLDHWTLGGVCWKSLF